MEQEVKNAVEEAKKVAELGLEALVVASFPSIETNLIAELKEVVPGESFDSLVDLIVPPAMGVIKTELLKQVEKISEQV